MGGDTGSSVRRDPGAGIYAVRLPPEKKSTRNGTGTRTRKGVQPWHWRGVVSRGGGGDSLDGRPRGIPAHGPRVCPVVCDVHAHIFYGGPSTCTHRLVRFCPKRAIFFSKKNGNVCVGVSLGRSLLDRPSARMLFAFPRKCVNGPGLCGCVVHGRVWVRARVTPRGRGQVY